MTRSTEYYTEKLRYIASRVGWALPEQTVSDLKELAASLERENNFTCAALALYTVTSHKEENHNVRSAL